MRRKDEASRSVTELPHKQSFDPAHRKVLALPFLHSLIAVNALHGHHRAIHPDSLEGVWAALLALPQVSPPHGSTMPYLRANWEGLHERNGGGKFPLNQLHSVDGVKLQRASRGGPRTCFLHGEMRGIPVWTHEPVRSYGWLILSVFCGCLPVLAVTMEQESRVAYVEALVSAKAIDVYVLKGGASTDYVSVGSMQGKQSMDHPFKYHYRCAAVTPGYFAVTLN